MTDRHSIAGEITATIKAEGAELCSLQDADGRELLWQAGPLWPSHSPALFAEDAIIMLAPQSRSLRYLGPGGGIEFGWEGFPQLGLWQKPGAELLCIEPWHGYASPADWIGEFQDKPGLFRLPPGETRSCSWTARPFRSG